MPAGWENDCEVWIEDGDLGSGWKTKPEVLHAETNAIAKLARSGEHGLDSDLFVTHAPCMDCAKLIYQAGIKRVFFGTAYRDNSGVDFLKASGIQVEQLEKGQ
jgi:dCMP deaminase